MSTIELAAERCLEEKIQSREALIGIVGMGYVGLPLALLFSEEGFRVTGFDIDEGKVRTLNAGESYIVRIPSTEVAAAQEKGFRAISNYEQVAGLDVIIICVPTPLNEYREPDLSYVENTLTALAPHVVEGQLIILESTTYPGTTEEVMVPLLNKGNALGLNASREPNQRGFFVAFSPEREDPGNNTVARRDIPKVVGGYGQTAREMACSVYSAIFNRVVPVSSPAAAEMTKLLENIYRCVNIALVNELKLLTLRMGIDIWEVIDAAATKPFGFHPFYPGPGLGGHCIPIDPFYLSWKAREYDFHTRFIEVAGEINTEMPYHVVRAVAEALNERERSLRGSKVLVMGVTYKKDIDDLRESPALTIIEALQKGGASVDYHDPYVEYIGRGRHYNLEMRRVSPDRVGEYDCVLIVTDHSAYDYADIVKKARLVVDTRNATASCRAANVVLC
jgi:UDP-N-acetyl-D-glucosamine dehydrogenase